MKFCINYNNIIDARSEIKYKELDYKNFLIFFYVKTIKAYHEL